MLSDRRLLSGWRLQKLMLRMGIRHRRMHNRSGGRIDWLQLHLHTSHWRRNMRIKCRSKYLLLRLWLRCRMACRTDDSLIAHDNFIGIIWIAHRLRGGQMKTLNAIL